MSLKNHTVKSSMGNRSTAKPPSSSSLLLLPLPTSCFNTQSWWKLEELDLLPCTQLKRDKNPTAAYWFYIVNLQGHYSLNPKAGAAPNSHLCCLFSKSVASIATRGRKTWSTQASWTPPHHLYMWQKPKKSFEFLISRLRYKACNIFCKSAVNPIPANKCVQRYNKQEEKFQECFFSANSFSCAQT